MDYCDVIISKPGGLTVTESIVKNTTINNSICNTWSRK